MIHAYLLRGKQEGIQHATRYQGGIDTDTYVMQLHEGTGMQVYSCCLRGNEPLREHLARA
eukprot:scaffold518_cov388-Prasinococcus_capsulatus_cf.AAC.42